MREQPSLQYLNAQIKNKVKKLNENVMLQIQVMKLRDELAVLNHQSEQLQETLDQALMETHMDSQQYTELINDPTRLEQKFKELYIDLKFKFPNTHPSQWFIPPVFETKLPELPRPSLKHREISVKMLSGCMYGYRCTKMRYHYLRCWSKQAALVKLEELNLALQAFVSNREALMSELSNLDLEVLRLTEGIQAKQEQIQGKTWLYESVFEYRRFCALARAFFQRTKSLEFDRNLVGDSSNETLPSLDISPRSGISGELPTTSIFAPRSDSPFDAFNGQNTASNKLPMPFQDIFSEPSSVDDTSNYGFMPARKVPNALKPDESLSVLYH